MTVIGALLSFRGLGEMSPYKRAPRRNDCAGTNLALTGVRVGNDEEWKARGCAASSSRPVTVQLSENLSWRFPDTHMIEKILRTDPNYALTFLRTIAGLIIFPYGMQKVFGWFRGPGIDGTLKDLDSLRIPKSIALLIIIGQSFGGIALVAGFLAESRPVVCS